MFLGLEGGLLGGLFGDCARVELEWVFFLWECGNRSLLFVRGCLFVCLDCIIIIIIIIMGLNISSSDMYCMVINPSLSFIARCERSRLGDL